MFQNYSQYYHWFVESQCRNVIKRDTLSTASETNRRLFTQICLYVYLRDDGSHEGCIEGCELGCDDGWELGCPLGCPDGCDDGWELGRELGCDEGCDEGCMVGSTIIENKTCKSN